MFILYSRDKFVLLKFLLMILLTCVIFSSIMSRVEHINSLNRLTQITFIRSPHCPHSIVSIFNCIASSSGASDARSGGAYVDDHTRIVRDGALALRASWRWPFTSH